MARQQYFNSCQDADAAAGAQTRIATGEQGIKLAAIGGLGQQFGNGSEQQLPAELQLVSPMTGGQQAVVADALEAAWQSMQEEASDEFFDTRSLVAARRKAAWHKLPTLCRRAGPGKG